MCPINVYGYTKAKAEEAVLKQKQNALIIRTNFYAWGSSYRQSFSDFIIDKVRSKSSIVLFEDVHYTPILAESMVNIAHKLIDNGAEGVFNVVNDKRVSKYQFGSELIEYFDHNSSSITKGRMEQVNNLVKRPIDMSLSNYKLKQFLNKKINGHREDFAILQQQEINGLAAELKRL